MDAYQTIIMAGLISTAVIQVLSLRQIRVVHRVINSRLDKWLAVEREQGNTAGREAQRKETAKRKRGSARNHG